jgi:hypothetical protein
MGRPWFEIPPLYAFGGHLRNDPLEQGGVQVVSRPVTSTMWSQKNPMLKINLLFRSRGNGRL